VTHAGTKLKKKASNTACRCISLMLPCNHVTGMQYRFMMVALKLSVSLTLFTPIAHDLTGAKLTNCSDRNAHNVY
jgi:hypothetical protein